MIINNDVEPVSPDLSVSDATAGEEGALDFTISLSDVYDQPVYVYYYTMSGTATEGLDYTGASGTVEIPVGSTSVTVSIPAITDVISNEGDETFTLILSTSSTLNISDSQGVGAISDTPVLPPIADDQSLETLEDTPLDITLTATSPTGSPLSFTIVTAPQFGSLSGSAPNLIYTPNPDYFGSDSFTFTAEENGIVSNTATVTIEVSYNNILIAEDATVETWVNTPLEIQVSATNTQSRPLSFEIITLPAHGALSGVGPHYTYTPNADYSGPDYFTFEATDGVGRSNTATVQITVRAPYDVLPPESPEAQACRVSYITVEDAVDPTATIVAGVQQGYYIETIPTGPGFSLRRAKKITFHFAEGVDRSQCTVVQWRRGSAVESNPDGTAPAIERAEQYDKDVRMYSSQWTVDSKDLLPQYPISEEGDNYKSVLDRPQMTVSNGRISKANVEFATCIYAAPIQAVLSPIKIKIDDASLPAGLEQDIATIPDRPVACTSWYFRATADYSGVTPELVSTYGGGPD